MTYLFVAFCVTWLAIFFYLLALSRQQRNLSREIDLLKRTQQNDKSSEMIEKRKGGG